jgi:hypothetical protein
MENVDQSLIGVCFGQVLPPVFGRDDCRKESKIYLSYKRLRLPVNR